MSALSTYCGFNLIHALQNSKRDVSCFICEEMLTWLGWLGLALSPTEPSLFPSAYAVDLSVCWLVCLSVCRLCLIHEEMYNYTQSCFINNLYKLSLLSTSHYSVCLSVGLFVCLSTSSQLHPLPLSLFLGNLYLYICQFFPLSLFWGICIFIFASS